MGYADLPWQARYRVLGDEAEAVFETVQPLGPSFQRFGWRRPDVSMAEMSSVIRHMPDYYTKRGYLVEVMGCGRDGILKLKDVKYQAIGVWHRHTNPVALFVWNSAEQTWALLDWVGIKRCVAYARRTEGLASFPEGNRYWPIPWETVLEEAVASARVDTDG